MTVQVQGITPKEAHAFLQKTPQAVFVDVRSTMEYLFVGHPVGAVNLAWIDEPDWTINPHFVTETRKLVLGGVSVQHAERDTPVVLICRSGKRSLEAGEALIAAGFHRVYNVSEGFEGDLDEHHHRSSVGGWRHAGLPWEQS